MTWAVMWFWLVIPSWQVALPVYGEDACKARLDEPGSHCVQLFPAHVRTNDDSAPGKNRPRSYSKAKQCVTELNPADRRGCERT